MNTPPDTDYTELHNAAATGDIDTLRACIAAGDPVNYVAGCNSKSALCRAVIGKHEKAVRLLIEAGANVNYHSDAPYADAPILHHAVETGSLNIVRLLLDAGAEVDYRERMFEGTPLLWAASHSDPAIAKLLLERGANPNVRSSYFGSFYAIHTAAMEGRTETVRLLLAAGADINQFNDEPTCVTPLHIADGNVLPLLLEAGADVNAAASEGVTPLHAAAYRGELGMARALLEAGACIDTRLTVDEESDVRGDEMCFRLPNGDESAFYCDEYVPIGSTPLHLAALQGHIALAELLLAHGANADACTQAGVSARELIWAARRKDTTKRLSDTRKANE